MVFFGNESSLITHEPEMSLSEGPALPSNFYQACMTNLNHSHIVLVGGKSTRFYYDGRTWILNLDNLDKGWIKMNPILITKRRSASCIVYQNKYLLVFGGRKANFVQAKTTEIMDLDEFREWRIGPSFPVVNHHNAIRYKDECYCFGTNGVLYKFSLKSGYQRKSKWLMLGQGFQTHKYLISLLINFVEIHNGS